MNSRRTFLRSTGAVAAMVSLAGCQFEIGDLANDEDPDEEDTDESDGVEEQLATAREHLGEAADDLRQVVEDEDTDFDDVDVEGQLGDAGDALDAAMGADPTETQRDQIEDLRTLRQVLELVLEASDQLGEGLNEVDRALDHFDDNEFDDAIEVLREAAGTLRRPEGRLDGSEEELEEVETEIDAHDEIEADAVWAVIHGYRDMTLAMQGMTAGFQDLNHGFDRFFLALDEWDEGNWFGAERHFDRANDRFEDAAATFLDAEADVPPEMHEDMSDLTCLAEAMSDATVHYQRAMEAAQDDDWDTFEEEADRGDEASERCE